jgi:hypothetical protein
MEWRIRERAEQPRRRGDFLELAVEELRDIDGGADALRAHISGVPDDVS